MPDDAAQLGFFELGTTGLRAARRATRDRPVVRGDQLVRLANEAAARNDPVERASLLVQLAREAGASAGDAILEANRAGRSWRSIGTQLGVPHQTVHRRFRR